MTTKPRTYITRIGETDSSGTGNGLIAIDDTIQVAGYPATAGSRTLEHFTPLFSAEAVERLQKAGYVLSGKTNVGEFGLDLTGEFSYFGACSGTCKITDTNGSVVADTLDVNFSAGTLLVALREVKGALQVDLNGTPRRAAAVLKTDFIKPTYGTVSRYGVIPCACSGEQIGVGAGNAETVRELLSVIAGHDAKDGTSLPDEKYDYRADLPVEKMRVGIVRELMDAASEEVKNAVLNYAERLRGLGVTVEEVSFPLVEASQTAWHILMCAETCNNLSRYDGVKFGYRTPDYRNIDELYVRSRTEGMNFLTKCVILYGSYVLSKGRYAVCYDRSMRIRRMVREQLNTLFEQYDALLTPAGSRFAYAPYDIADAFETVFRESLFTSAVNLTGIPAMVTGGVQLLANVREENTLFSLAEAAEADGKAAQ